MSIYLALTVFVVLTGCIAGLFFFMMKNIMTASKVMLLGSAITEGLLLTAWAALFGYMMAVFT